MWITWSTKNDTPQSIVEYGHYNLDSVVTGGSELFTENTHTQYIHRVKITNLKPNTVYRK